MSEDGDAGLEELPETLCRTRGEPMGTGSTAEDDIVSDICDI